MSQDPFVKYNEHIASSEVTKKVLALASKKINPKPAVLILKYGATFVFSIFFSLALCPQRGVGLFGSEFPFFHHILHQSEILCGLYCGLVFFITTHLLTFLTLNHFERIKITSQLSYLPILFISSFFGLSMTSWFSKMDFSSSYNISWILIVGLSYFALNHFYLRKFKL